MAKEIEEEWKKEVKIEGRKEDDSKGGLVRRKEG